MYVENHAEECIEFCVGQKLGSIHSMCIDKQAWIKEELRGSTSSYSADLGTEHNSSTLELKQDGRGEYFPCHSKIIQSV